MAWTTPRTWVSGELVTAALMNTHVRDNLTYLKDAPAFTGTVSNSITSSTSYAAIFKTPTVGLTAGNYVNMAYFTNSRGVNNDGIRIVNVRDTTGSGSGDWPTESYRIRRSVDQNDGSTGVQEEIVFGNNILAFNTSGTERMQIDASGNVSIGKPRTYPLSVADGSTTTISSVLNTLSTSTTAKYSALRFEGTDTVSATKETADILCAPGDQDWISSSLNFYVRISDATSNRLAISTTGHIILQASSRLYMDGGSNNYLVQGSNLFTFVCNGSSALQVNANGVYHYTMLTTASAANTYCADNSNLYRVTSSLRWKHDVETLDTAVAMQAVLAMRPVTYRGTTDADQRRHVGFIAEEMQHTAPLLCTYDEGGEAGTPNYVTYDRVTAYLVAAVQHQQNEIDALKARIQ